MNRNIFHPYALKNIYFGVVVDESQMLSLL